MLTKNKNPKVSYVGRILVLPLAILVFAAFTLKAKPFKNNENPVYKGKKITVVVDAGHGGSDHGAYSTDGSITEKELTLAIIKKIKSLNSNANINLVLTRETDIFQTVQEKADFTKAQNADLFVSIHIDGTPEKAADTKTGLSVYVAKDHFKNAASSKLFASAVINEFKNGFPLSVVELPLQSAIGIKVLQESTCPAVLIEAGYITNKKDLAYLKTDAGKDKIASNILAAIERYAFAKEKELTIAEQSISATAEKIAVTKTDTVPELNLKNYDKAMIIADGEVISNAALKKINPEDIKSISILKDKSATAVYGEKGKNGVIIINTKTTEIVSKTVPELNLKNYDNALIIADGEEISNATLKKLKPESIKAINVLKGKSAIAGYGEKGKNGVIIINTKTTEIVSKQETSSIMTDIVSDNKTTKANVQFRINSQAPSKQPLYVIDGKINSENMDINRIDPNSIQSINVFKGESAQKKYGDAGMDGVIEITTKNNAGIKQILVTDGEGNNSLKEVVVVGYGTRDNKNMQSIQNEPIFTVAENEPSFPGGQPAWERYLQKNLNAKLPIEEGWNPGQYKITISFIVRKDGSIADIKTDDYPGSKTSEHCIELIRKGPKWEPALQNGQKVNAYRKQPITFIVEKK